MTARSTVAMPASVWARTASQTVGGQIGADDVLRDSPAEDVQGEVNGLQLRVATDLVPAGSGEGGVAGSASKDSHDDRCSSGRCVSSTPPNRLCRFSFVQPTPGLLSAR